MDRTGYGCRYLCAFFHIVYCPIVRIARRRQRSEWASGAKVHNDVKHLKAIKRMYTFEFIVLFLAECPIFARPHLRWFSGGKLIRWSNDTSTCSKTRLICAESCKIYSHFLSLPLLTYLRELFRRNLRAFYCRGVHISLLFFVFSRFRSLFFIGHLNWNSARCWKWLFLSHCVKSLCSGLIP